ncbi:MAG TPA: cobalamin biosynthesis protein CbiD [Clostridiales bacterium]|nr:cobalamin biosynthesis protein CbiD [Clostridiales bacterium]
MKECAVRNVKKISCGFTTGTCAAAAATAAAIMLFSGKIVYKVYVKLPTGEMLLVDIGDQKFDVEGVSCCVKKGSDDSDLTDSVLIYAKIRLNPSNGICIEGGTGVGIVTQNGMNCPVGSAAINSVPRKMIAENIKRICDDYKYSGGVNIVISVPGGEELAEKTFITRLGVTGGILITGITGVVEPVSEKAFIESLRVEMEVIREKGYTILLAFPGNHAQSFIDRSLGIVGENCIKFGNYLGEILDFAMELDFNEILIACHIGKIVKVAGGMMNTHYRNGDFRMEVFACYAALYGAGRKTVEEILGSITSEQVLDILESENIEKSVIDKIREKAEYYINKRVENKIRTKLIIYSNNKGILN